MLTYYLQNEPLPKYFACQGAEQCRRVMLQTKKNPSDQEIREWLEGNICRCTGYQNIVAAVKEAATKM